MKRVCCVVILLMGLPLSITSAAKADSTDIQSVLANSHRPFFPGELLVKCKETVSPEREAALHRNFEVSEVRGGYDNSYQIISVSPGTEWEVAEAYAKRAEIEYAEPNYYYSLYAIPDDQFYPLQWNFPLINLPDAWDVSTGDGVTVAVIDTGVNPFGFDSFGRRLDNRVLLGYNAIWKTRGGLDLESHGTLVAGIIGQETNNGTGTAGIAFNAKILPVKVLWLTGEGLNSWIIHGIRWAANHGADIINLSLGGFFRSRALEDAVNYAYEKGVTVVGAAGNDGVGEVIYPAAFENCIAVGAVNYDKTLTDYSNYGETLDLVAPGGSLTEDQNDDGVGDGILQEGFMRSGFLNFEWNYWYATGTSMAAPHVAGVAALIKSRHPEYGPDEIREVLQDTAEDLGAPGWDERYGYGLVDAHAAVSY
jgi:serine protease